MLKLILLIMLDMLHFATCIPDVAFESFRLAWKMTGALLMSKIIFCCKSLSGTLNFVVCVFIFIYCPDDRRQDEEVILGKGNEATMRLPQESVLRRVCYDCWCCLHSGSYHGRLQSQDSEEGAVEMNTSIYFLSFFLPWLQESSQLNLVL